MTDFTQLTVLVVDDNLASRRLPSFILSPLGANVLESSNGTHALHLLKTQPITHVVLDISMPEMNGLEIAERIQNSSEIEPKPTIIAYTADATLAHLQDTLPFDHVLLKPIRARDLLRIF